MVTVNQICVISFFGKFFYSGVWLFWLVNLCSPGGISEFFWPHTLRKAQGWGPVFVTTKIKDGKMMSHRVENPSIRLTILFFSEWTVKVTQSCPTLWHPLDYIYSPWNSPSQNTGVGSLSLLQQIFLTQELNQSTCIAGGFLTNWTIREAPRVKNPPAMQKTWVQSLGWQDLLEKW